MGSEKPGGTVELSRGVYWTGAIDWNGRDFHGFTTPCGTSYNSYLVAGEKTALIDTVKAPFAGEMLRRITRIIDPSKLDYIVVNHMEPDYAGSLAEIKKQTSAKIFITRRGADFLNGYSEISEVQTGILRLSNLVTIWTMGARPSCSSKLPSSSAGQHGNFQKDDESSSQTTLWAACS
jgi:flavorubredoxin